MFFNFIILPTGAEKFIVKKYVHIYHEGNYLYTFYRKNLRANEYVLKLKY